MPDGQAERDLVDDIRDVVGKVARRVTPLVHKVAKEVSQRVDGPTNGDDEPHGVVAGLDVTVDLVGVLRSNAGLAEEDFEEDESPSGHTQDEAQPSVHAARLTEISEYQHQDCSNHQAPEDSTADVRLDSREDQVELDHLKRDGDGPVDVSVDDRGVGDLHPVFTHVEVVHSSDQRNEGTDMERGLPMTADHQCFHQKEDGCGDHGDRDNPEGNRDRVVSVEESSVMDDL